nr:N,N-dimethylformamidase beta subunit family domain-containing protein [Bradyrhizobium sp. Rc2d]
MVLLAPYGSVLTGTHPEYHTLNTLDALQAYTDNGGKLIYLGGTGFYWRIASRKEVQHFFELRRAECGLRLWAAEPGEYFHSLDGQLGGLWRRHRRAPQMLVGIGFVAQGAFESTHFRAACSPPMRPPTHGSSKEWTKKFRHYGLSGGGAAGCEFDHVDAELGTPANAVILTRSEGAPASLIAE